MGPAVSARYLATPSVALRARPRSPATRYVPGPALPAGLASLWAVTRDLQAVLATAVRMQAGTGPHAEMARQVVVALLFAQLLAAGGTPAPERAPGRAPREDRPRRSRRPHREALAGRRPRG